MTTQPTTEQLYEELVALSEVSLELVREEQYEALEPVHEACRALIEKLPTVPPQSVAAKLERVAALDAEKQRLLAEQMGLVRGALVKIERGRHALGGYGAEPACLTAARVDRTG